jgi:hypothetical protein
MYDYSEAAIVKPPRPSETEESSEREDRIAETLAKAEGEIETFTDDSGYTREVKPGPVRAAATSPAEDGSNAIRPQRVDATYMLEKSDPKHRMGSYLYLLNEEFAKLPSERRQKMQFFSWVDAINVMDFKRIISKGLPDLAPNKLGWWVERLQTFQQGVKYKDDTNLRDKYLVKVEAGLLKRRGKVSNGKWVDTGKLEPLSTSDSTSHWSGGGWAIWVESTNKTFYTNRMKMLKFQHTSFLSGSDVRGAGEWYVVGGKLRQISGRSGHYQPTLDHLLQALRDLEAKNVVGLGDVDVVLFRRPAQYGNAQVLVKWRDLKTTANPNQDYKVDPKAG